MCLCWGTTQIIAKLPSIALATATVLIPIAMYKMTVVIIIVIIVRLAIAWPSSSSRWTGHPKGSGIGRRGVAVVAVAVGVPGRRSWWWWIGRGRRVPCIQPRIDRVGLVTVRRVPVLVHRAGTAHRGQRHLRGRLQVLLRPVELGPRKVRAGRSGPTAGVTVIIIIIVRQILLGTVQRVFGIAGTIKVRARFRKAPTIQRLGRLADLLQRQVLQRLRDELELGP